LAKKKMALDFFFDDVEHLLTTEEFLHALLPPTVFRRGRNLWKLIRGKSLLAVEVWHLKALSL